MNASEPRAVILDFGGVIWNMRWDVGQALEAEHGLPDLAGERRAGAGGARGACAAAPLHLAWREAQGPVAENIATVRALRPPYRLAILSNADLTLRARIAERLGIGELFDDIVCSAEVGLATPDPAIYALVCARLDLPPAACVFVDDREPNVRAAEAHGLRGILHRIDDGDDLRAQLAALGVAARP